jgi:hypothetical protein
MRLLLLLGILSYSVGFAQEYNHSQQKDTLGQAFPQDRGSIKHYFGWGGNIAEGDITFGRDQGELLLSFLYSQKIAPTNEIEISLHRLAVQRYRDFNGRILPDSLPYTALTWQGDVSWMFQPFTGIFKNIRIGIGPTLRLHTLNLVDKQYASKIISTKDTINVPSLEQTVFTELFSIGANIKAEYLIPLSENVELGVRGQLHTFLPPIHSHGMFQFAVSQVSGLASAGAYIRVGMPDLLPPYNRLSNLNSSCKCEKLR